MHMLGVRQPGCELPRAADRSFARRLRPPAALRVRRRLTSSPGPAALSFVPHATRPCSVARRARPAATEVPTTRPLRPRPPDRRAFGALWHQFTPIHSHIARRAASTRGGAEPLCLGTQIAAHPAYPGPNHGCGSCLSPSCLLSRPCSLLKRLASHCWRWAESPSSLDSFS
jgi:hypothetical protein